MGNKVVGCYNSKQLQHLVYGAAGCGHLSVTEEKQIGLNPIYTALKQHVLPIKQVAPR